MSTLRALQRAILARPSRVRDLASGQTYRRLGFVLQPTPDGTPRRLVLYAAESASAERITGLPLEPGTLWARPEEEFTRDRFEALNE